ncbi:MAG: FtsX-like permease family protein [Acidobacteria bacterium]|nr:FtsX-like permease family protein [Acidobacteriota bacterium]
MLISESFKVAFENLFRHKLRTTLTMLGIIFGVAAVLSMLAIGAGAEQESLTLIRNMGLRNIMVKAKEFAPNEQKIIRQDSPGLSRRDVAALRQALPDGSLAVGKKVVKTYQIFSRLGKSDSRVLAVNALYPQAMGLQLLAGTFFLPVDEAKANPVCVLGTTARRKLFGVNDPVGEPVKINEEWFTVVGVLADQYLQKDEFEGVKLENPSNDIYVPLAAYTAKFEPDPVANELDEIVIQIPEGADLAVQAALVSSMVGSMHRQIDDFNLVVPEKLLAQNRQTQQIFNVVMGAIASISLLVGGIGIMNIMLASVLERTNEIGLRRALGARRRDISRQFVLESVGLSAGGSLLGIALGFGIAQIVSVYSGWATVVTVWSVLLGVGVSCTVGLVFGIYPAQRAARISPIEALRHE